MRLLGQSYFFFFHNKISQAQNRLQQTMIKKNTHKKHLREKKLLICLFAFCGSILLVLLVKKKEFKRSQETSFYVFTSPTKLDFICIVLV